MKYDWKNMTEEQKAQAARCEANLPTHNGTTKEELADIIRWQQSQIKPVGWIKVSDRLPEIYQQDNGEPMEFIVMIKGAIVPTVLSYNGTEWFQMDWTNTRAGSSYAVTHWMPLPEPPRDDLTPSESIQSGTIRQARGDQP